MFPSPPRPEEVYKSSASPPPTPNDLRTNSCPLEAERSFDMMVGVDVKIVNGGGGVRALYISKGVRQVFTRGQTMKSSVDFDVLGNVRAGA